MGWAGETDAKVPVSGSLPKVTESLLDMKTDLTPTMSCFCATT